MPRLIDAEHLKKRATDWWGDCWDNYAQSTEDFLEYIDNEPTVDAERHGHWIITPYGHMTCSSCEWLFEYYDGLEEEWNYCPHCGAKMDETEYD